MQNFSVLELGRVIYGRNLYSILKIDFGMLLGFCRDKVFVYGLLIGYIIRINYYELDFINFYKLYVGGISNNFF